MEELLIALAIAALGGTVNVLGVAIARSIEKHVAAELTKHVFFDAKLAGGGRWVRELGNGRRTMISGDDAKWIQDTATISAKYLGEFGKDSFKDGIKSIGGPRIRDLLKAGKLPIDAFFEGKKATATDAAKRASDKLEGHRTETLKNSGDAVIASAAVAHSLDEHYSEAGGIQKDESVREWLRYQAESRIGSLDVKNPDGTKDVAANMEHMPGQVGGVVPNNVAGVVSVDLYPTIGQAPGFKLIGGSLPGLTHAMLTQLSGKSLKDLGLPIVFRVVADREGRGFYSPPGSFTGEDLQFNIRVNESGQLWNGAKYAWHKKVLADWVGGAAESEADVNRGAEAIAFLRYALTLIDLRVKADKA